MGTASPSPGALSAGNGKRGLHPRRHGFDSRTHLHGGWLERLQTGLESQAVREGEGSIPSPAAIVALAQWVEAHGREP